MRNRSQLNLTRRMGPPQKLGELLSNLISRRGYAQQQTNEEIGQAWNEIVGQSLSQNSRIGRVRRGVLEILVSNSVALQELQFEKTLFLRRLKGLLPQHEIRDLRFRIVGDSS